MKSPQAELAVAREALRAIRNGEVDALVETDEHGEPRVYTLQGADEPYRLMLDTMSEGGALISAQGVIIYCNQCLSRFLKQPLETVLGAGMSHFVCPADRPVFEQLVKEAWHGSSKGDISLQCEDGTLVPVRLACSVLPGDGSKAVGLVATDLTKHMRARRELLETVVELEAFSYSLSHDLRAPLRAIIGFSELALEETQGNAGASRHLSKVISAAARMDRMLQELLTISKLSCIELTLGRVDLEDLLGQILAERPDFQPPQVEIRVKSPLLAVCGHEGLLTQCLTNLLSNACKFVAPGVAPRIEVSTERIGTEVRLWIEDNGIGISPAARSILFRRFGRIHSGGAYEGTGIGLSIVRRAVERMGGSAGVEPGRGSRFWIQLPADNTT
jgi:PAS domain S-box-containing protein